MLKARQPFRPCPAVLLLSVCHAIHVQQRQAWAFLEWRVAALRGALLHHTLPGTDERDSGCSLQARNCPTSARRSWQPLRLMRAPTSTKTCPLVSSVASFVQATCQHLLALGRVSEAVVGLRACALDCLQLHPARRTPPSCALTQTPMILEQCWPACASTNQT